MWMLDEKNKTPLYTQLYERIKADIFNGTLKPGTKLKSSRAVSMELHISRNTVEWPMICCLPRALSQASRA